MCDYLYRKFPQLIDDIQALRAKDATFCEACADYEEICTWLTTQTDRATACDPEEWAHARELRCDLEDEILKLLEESDELIS